MSHTECGTLHYTNREILNWFYFNRAVIPANLGNYELRLLGLTRKFLLNFNVPNGSPIQHRDCSLLGATRTLEKIREPARQSLTKTMA